MNDLQNNDRPFLQVSGLTKHYDTLDLDASFELDEGSFTTILGQSGSGKTTLLRIIAGFEKSDGPDCSIKMEGKEISFLPPSRRNLGMVFQDGALFQNMKAIDNVAYGLVSRGTGRKEARKEALDFMKGFGIEGLCSHYPETLSGGEAQRVALARTLIVKPKLILFDEPLSALDAPLRKKLAAEIKNMQKQYGFTAIMVTHSIEEARAVSDRIIFIKKGKIAFNSRAEEFDEKLYFE